MLVNVLSHTPGAHLLLLDVMRKGTGPADKTAFFRDQIDQWSQSYPDACNGTWGFSAMRGSASASNR